MNSTSDAKYLGTIILIFSFITLVLVLIGLWKLSLILITSDSDIAKAISGATITGALSVFAVVLSKWMDRKKAIEESLREKKSQIYEDFLKYWISILNKETVENQQDLQEKTVAFMRDKTHQIVVWASDDVLKAYSDFRENTLTQLAGGKKLEAKIIMGELEKLFKVVRRDLGHKNKNLSDGDILTLFINDARKHFADSNTNNHTNHA